MFTALLFRTKASAARTGLSVLALTLASSLACAGGKTEKSDSGKPAAAPSTPSPAAAAGHKPEKSDSGKPAKPAAAGDAAKAAKAANGPGTQTEDDAMVGAKTKKTKFP